MICGKLKFKKFGFHLLSSTIENVFYCPGADKSKISAQPNTTLSIQFLDRENNDKNNTLPLGKQICLTIAWGCAEILPLFLQHRNKCEFWYFVGFTVIFVVIFLSVFSFSVFSLILSVIGFRSLFCVQF